jgi:hypothetical protein
MRVFPACDRGGEDLKNTKPIVFYYFKRKFTRSDMGSSQDVMHTYIAREVSGNFPQSAGWTVAQSRTLSRYNKVFFIERYQNGTIESVKVGVTFDRAVPKELIDLMNAAIPYKPSFPVSRTRIFLMAPKNTDTLAVPASWKVHFMNAFGFEDEALIWYKKPVRKEKEEEAKKQAVPKPA